MKRQDREVRRLQLLELARKIVQQPINSETELARTKLVLCEPPRWNPDQAKAKHVGDPIDVDVFDYPDVLDRVGGAS